MRSSRQVFTNRIGGVMIALKIQNSASSHVAVLSNLRFIDLNDPMYEVIDGVLYAIFPPTPNYWREEILEALR